jgi:cytosine/adenosine deaminase-related metal-dependent hydrolase
MNCVSTASLMIECELARANCGFSSVFRVSNVAFELGGWGVRRGVPVAVLRAATYDAARCLGWEGEVGSLQPGRYADLLAVEGHELRDLDVLTGPALVIKGGRVVTGAELRTARTGQRAALDRQRTL